MAKVANRNILKTKKVTTTEVLKPKTLLMDLNTPMSIDEGSDFDKDDEDSNHTEQIMKESWDLGRK